MAKPSGARRLGTGAALPQGKAGARPKVAHSSAALPAKLDALIHDRTRLAIVSALAVTPTLSFTELKTATGATDGNLSVHARRLEDAGYVRCEKKFAGRTPRTEYRLTPDGRRALQRYLDHMDAIIQATRRA